MNASRKDLRESIFMESCYGRVCIYLCLQREKKNINKNNISCFTITSSLLLHLRSAISFRRTVIQLIIYPTIDQNKIYYLTSKIAITIFINCRCFGYIFFSVITNHIRISLHLQNVPSSDLPDSYRSRIVRKR